MAVHCPRIYYIIKYSVTCMTISTFLLFFVTFTIQNHSLNHLNFSLQQYKEDSLLINQSSLTYNIEQTTFYPHLPIQIYTQNRQKYLQLENKTKKLILLATPFFDDPTWALKSLKNKTNFGDMSELHCSFLNEYCELTNDITRFKQADAVVYHARENINRTYELMKSRHSSQRFIFALWESPIHTPDLRSYNQFFNWTMTYRFDSHILASYYFESRYFLRNNSWLQTILSDHQSDKERLILHENINTTKKKGTVAALISNCMTAYKDRLSLITELKKYVDVTIYGKCGIPCPTSSTNESIDCRKYIGEHYYFFLSFENSYCQDYTTEKMFVMITLPIIPIVLGRTDYPRYIPQSGFIDVRQFPSVSELGARLHQIRNNLTIYQEYFKWKQDFIWPAISQFMSPFCDLCLRLHLDTTPSIINDIHQWWFHNTCQPNVKQYF